ncbi:hypothetical protein [Chitinophaga deserti]|uniref:hypothetical protein n=1 Tax=Chitinophaga deserti TaxID=2164099 RepID=UPI000D6D5C69|nr:hypothetical protein [Chitinophaga deserti]
MNLNDFITKISGFDDLSSSGKIDYFVYFVTIIKRQDGTISKKVGECFDELKIPRYSNIPAYLSSRSKKNKSRKPIFILQKGQYHLERTRQIEIENELGHKKKHTPTNSYFPLEILDNSRSYLKWIGEQASGCFDQGFYDACNVMTRKLLEVLIIEAFERHKISQNIKGTDGNFYYLSDLIDRTLNESSWNISRNAKQGLAKIKKKGDLSAHNRRFVARKSELEDVKEDLRIVIEELVHLIDYPNWTKLPE